MNKKRILGAWAAAIGIFAGSLAVIIDVWAGSVMLSGYYGLADAARIVGAQRISGDASKVVYVERWSNAFGGQSLSSWVSPQNPADADRARVWLYDIASQSRTLLYQADFTTVTSGADTLLQSMEDGFSVDINSDGSKVVMAYTATSFNGARDRLTSQLKIDVIDTASLAVTPIAALGVPGFSGWNVPLRMSEPGGTAVFAYEAVGNTTSNVWGITYDDSSSVTKLMTLALTPGAPPVELCNSGVYGTAYYNELISSINSRYAGFFDVSADGTRVVFQHSGDGKVIGVMNDGSGWREIASVTSGKAAYVSISGDGQTVAYVDRGQNYAVLYANSFDGGQQRVINSDMTYWAGHLILNGDGSNLLYQTQDAGPGSSFGYNSTSYQIATAAGSTPEMIAYDLRDASGLGGKVLTSEYNSANLYLATITPAGATTTTTTTTPGSTTTSSIAPTSTTAFESTTTTTVEATTSTTTTAASTTTDTSASTTTTTGMSTTTTSMPYHQPLFGINLLVNGDAEAASGSSDGSIVTIPGWTVTGSMTAVTYENSSGFPTAGDPGPFDRGLNLFAGGPDVGSSTMSQMFDVSAAAADIDAGSVSYFLSGFLGGWSYQGDNAVLSVDFKTADGTVTGSASAGPVTNTDRGDATGLWMREVMGVVPAATRQAEVRLTATRTEGSYNDGYADNLAFVLFPGGGSSTSSTTTTTGETTTTTTVETTTTTEAGGGTTTTTTTVTTTTLAGGGTFEFGAGWNLVGNSASEAIDVVAAFADTSKVTTVWKWVADTARWAFYAPSLGAQQLIDYATSKGYDVLASIAGGEGFWVNAKTAFSAPTASGTPIASTVFQTDAVSGQSKLVRGWNLIAIGDNKTPSQFNISISATPPEAGQIPNNVTTLWAWDAHLANWYFYAPSLDAKGGSVLADYITNKNYLNFYDNTLGPTTGFWVNKP